MMPTPQHTQDLVQRLVTRDATRTEADIQADIQGLLTGGGLSLDPGQVVRLEVPTADGTRRRLDVEVGHCVIEVKKDLRPPTIRHDAQIQLAGYVVDRSQLHGRRYVGVLTDGVEWVLYDLRDEALVEVASLRMVSADAERLLTWLEAILVTESAVKPTPEQIRQRLGVDSPGHLLDHAQLAAFYAKGKTIPEVALKRQLWARLLKTAFGSAFRDASDTFLDHTLLVITAEIIAHAVIGVDISATGTAAPSDILSGRTFKDYGIGGVVEADFFDWVLQVDGGAEFVSTLAERLSRFDWSAVEHDVLKHLYESVITAKDRAALGEYYTPDWLADRAVAAAVGDPLNQRVLDPSCGSGTFVFHAARLPRRRRCRRDRPGRGYGRADLARHWDGHPPGRGDPRPGDVPARDRVRTAHVGEPSGAVDPGLPGGLAAVGAEPQPVPQRRHVHDLDDVGRVDR